MSQRKNILRKAVEKIKEPFNDYEKSLTLIDKHELPTAYGALGSDFTHGAASVHDKSINLKHAYTPKTIAVRAAQRASLGALAGLGASYLSGSDTSGALSNAGVAAGVGALAGATVGPALSYASGKFIEKTRQKTKERIQNKKD